MLTPKLVVTMISPETGRPRPTELDVLPEPLTAAEHGLMVGNPPPDDKWVHHGNWTAWPNIRWSLTHMDELRASGRISRGLGPAEPLPVAAPGETGSTSTTWPSTTGTGVTGRSTRCCAAPTPMHF